METATENLVKVVKGYRITIPPAIRRRLSIKEGDFVVLDLNDSKAILTPVNVEIKPR